MFTVTMCAGTSITIPGTEIQSPNYPNTYPRNQDCQLVITFENGERIALEFLAFHLHTFCGSYGSGYDHLAIRDGDNENSNLIGQILCGSQIPSRIVSSGNTLYIKFTTNSGGNSFSGFRIKASIDKLV